jgi:hypothetical protein
MMQKGLGISHRSFPRKPERFVTNQVFVTFCIRWRNMGAIQLKVFKSEINKD